MKADIVCLQETHAPSHDTIKKWFANSGYRVASSCHTNKSCGTAILIKDSFTVNKIVAPPLSMDQVLDFRRAALPCSRYCNRPRPTLCGAIYILGASLIRGRMGLVPLHPG